MKKLSFGLFWFLIMWLGTVAICSGVAGGIAASKTNNSEIASSVGEAAGREFGELYGMQIGLISLAIAMLGTNTGILPGTGNSDDVKNKKRNSSESTTTTRTRSLGGLKSKKNEDQKEITATDSSSASDKYRKKDKNQAKSGSIWVSMTVSGGIILIAYLAYSIYQLDRSYQKLRLDYCESQDFKIRVDQVYLEELAKHPDKTVLQTYKTKCEEGWTIEKIQQDISVNKEAQNK